MPDADPLRRYLEAGLELAQMTRARAEAIVRELVKAGEVGREQAQDRVEELLDRSKKGSETLLGLIRREVGAQLSSMGFATKEDLDRMEERLAGAGVKAPAKKAAGAKAAAKKAQPTKKAAPAKKASRAAKTPPA